MRASFEDFFESPTHRKLETLLYSQGGEYDNLDYKAEWPEYPKVARHILAIGNCGGGVLVLGVSQRADGSLATIGLERIQDKAEISKGLSKYLPKPLEWYVHDFAFEEGPLIGKKFQVIMVEYRPEILPLVSEAEGKGIRQAAIYARRGTSSEEADYHELQKIVNARIDTSYSSSKIMTIEEHLDELRALYGRMSPYRSKMAIIAEQLLSLTEREPNPDYPQESYDQYMSKLIERKKSVIDAVVGEGPV